MPNPALARDAVAGQRSATPGVASCAFPRRECEVERVADTQSTEAADVVHDGPSDGLEQAYAGVTSSTAARASS
jgi:hypothetical protein